MPRTPTNRAFRSGIPPHGPLQNLTDKPQDIAAKERKSCQIYFFIILLGTTDATELLAGWRWFLGPDAASHYAAL